MALALSDFLPVWAFLAANIVSPGPNVLTTISLAIGSGRKAGMGAALGVGLGIAFWCLGTTLGMSAIFALFPALQPALLFLAIGLLLWFSFRYLRAAYQGYLARGMLLPPSRQGASLWEGFRRSTLVNLMNPKAMTSWLAILSLFPLARATSWDIALFCLGACLLSFSIHSVYALAFSTPAAAKLWLRMSWAIQGLAGILFAFFALRLALTA